MENVQQYFQQDKLNSHQWDYKPTDHYVKPTVPYKEIYMYIQVVCQMENVQQFFQQDKLKGGYERLRIEIANFTKQFQAKNAEK